jgi:hypothetical protein
VAGACATAVPTGTVPTGAVLTGTVPTGTLGGFRAAGPAEIELLLADAGRALIPIAELLAEAGTAAAATGPFRPKRPGTWAAEYHWRSDSRRTYVSGTSRPSAAIASIWSHV